MSYKIMRLNSPLPCEGGAWEDFQAEDLTGFSRWNEKGSEWPHTRTWRDARPWLEADISDAVSTPLVVPVCKLVCFPKYL